MTPGYRSIARWGPDRLPWGVGARALVSQSPSEQGCSDATGCGSGVEDAAAGPRTHQSPAAADGTGGSWAARALPGAEASVPRLQFYTQCTLAARPLRIMHK